MTAHGRDAAHDLVAGHAGIDRARPFAADLVQVRMADAAKDDLDLHVMGARLAPGDRHFLQRAVRGGGSIGKDGHPEVLSVG